MVMFGASDVIEYDGRITELSNVALHMKQDANNIEKFKV